jgi:hypothetical protein
VVVVPGGHEDDRLAVRGLEHPRVFVVISVRRASTPR